MNGAEGIVRTLVASDVDHCFTNPGTSEMYFVEALDRIEGLRCVLCLFENVATGAADGFGRMADRPASTLLHLGPGLANGWSNLHNAARAQAPVVNLIGEHATYHREFETPLKSDIEGLATRVPSWVRCSESVETVCADTAQAVSVAGSSPGRIATQIIPLDVSWSEGAEVSPPLPSPAPQGVPPEAVREAAGLIRSGEPTLLLLTGKALRRDALEHAGRIARRFSNVEVMAQTSNGRVERGSGRFPVERIPYPVDKALARLKHFGKAVLVGAQEPIAFFAYPGKPSRLLPDDCERFTLAGIAEDLPQALAALADDLGAREAARLSQPQLPPAVDGALTPDALSSLIANGLPDHAVVIEESVSVGRGFYAAMAGAPPHDWLQVTGGAIGNGPPMALGAAMACPERRVICLEGDGSAMYTSQALWTMAREGLGVTMVVLNNASYAILHGEFKTLAGTAAGKAASQIMDLSDPSIDWLALAQAMGVPATRARDAGEFRTAFSQANSSPGPHLIEAVVAR